MCGLYSEGRRAQYVPHADSVLFRPLHQHEPPRAASELLGPDRPPQYGRLERVGSDDDERRTPGGRVVEADDEGCLMRPKAQQPQGQQYYQLRAFDVHFCSRPYIEMEAGSTVQLPFFDRVDRPKSAQRFVADGIRPASSPGLVRRTVAPSTQHRSPYSAPSTPPEMRKRSAWATCGCIRPGATSTPRSRFLPPARHAGPENRWRRTETGRREVQRKDGPKLAGLIGGTVVRKEVGTVQHVEGVVSDITDPKEAGAFLRDSMITSKRCFTTPMTAIPTFEVVPHQTYALSDVVIESVFREEASSSGVRRSNPPRLRDPVPMNSRFLVTVAPTRRGHPKRGLPE